MSVRVETDGPVRTVMLYRPEVRNAVDGPTAAALADAFRDFDADADADAAVAVLWGEGGTFCAGADLKAVGTDRGNRVAADGDGPMGPTRMTLGKPVIAAISGYAVAGGLELAIWCDLRVAEEDAIFGVFCRRWGVPLVDGGTVRLPRLIGTSRAMDLILTGRPVPAQEAYEMGLVNRVVPRGEARRAAEELAHRIAGFPPTCLRHDRLSVLEGHGMDADAAMANEFRHGEISLAADAASGAARFAAGAGRHGDFSQDSLRETIAGRRSFTEDRSRAGNRAQTETAETINHEEMFPVLSRIRRRRRRSKPPPMVTMGAAVGGLVLAAGLTACGGGEDDPSGSSGASAAVRQVQGAYEKMTQAGTVRVSVGGRQPASGASAGPPSQQSTISGEAELDFGENSSTLVIDGQGGAETRTIKGIQYQKVAKEQRQQVPGNKPWIKIDMTEAAKAQYGDRAAEVVDEPPIDPAGVLPYLRAVRNAKQAGTADVRGTATKRYDVTVDLQKGTKDHGPQLEQQTASLQQQLGPALDMSVWLDQQGLLWRLETTLPAGGQPGAQQNITLTEDFYDHGNSLQIRPPSDNDTADVTQQVIQQQQLQQQQQQQQQQAPQQPQPQQT